MADELDIKRFQNRNKKHTFLAYQETLYAAPDCGRDVFQTEAATSSAKLHQVVLPATNANNHHMVDIQLM